MLITKLVLKNWRNFREAELDLRDCSYLVGANATGKSNLLDAFRFLRDLSKGDVVELFGQVTYFHLIPHLLKNEALNRNVQIDDGPFGHGFLERIAHTPAKTRRRPPTQNSECT